MAVTNLTNTTWLINSTTCTASYGQFQIDFDRDEWGTYEDFYIGYGGTPDGPYPLANSVNIQPAGPDFLQVNDIITITGGTDVTNASLISWLTANATQILTPDLVVDLSQLSLTPGTTYTIHATAYAEGYAESAASNTVEYKKQASGFSVSGVKHYYDIDDPTNKAYYSLDDGATWIDFNTIPDGNFTINNVQQIKFKLIDTHDAYWVVAESQQLGLNISGQYDVTSSNYTLTQDITDLSVYVYFD